ncbi:hypothetical protein EON80_19065 [bacterium]|nr:MAG: hypothetical protein EON80_19065 [bacterium]
MRTRFLPLVLLATAGQAQTKPAPAVFEVDDVKTWVNVMKNAKPKTPTFTALTPKPGYVRGFVKDSSGKPLQNARLGVRSTSAGGFYSGAQGKTDARGYYEIKVPWGAAHFYNAGFSIEYGDGRVACSLHPADGQLDSFASAKGAVENFVLLDYGITNPDKVQDQPHYSGNYYGGYCTFDWNVADENPTWAEPSYLPANCTIEITFTPQAPLRGGIAAKSFVIRKQVNTVFGRVSVLNLPITTYRVSAKIVGGVALKMTETGPNGGGAFGIEPKKNASTVTLQLRPSSAQAERAVAGVSNWDPVSIQLTR